MNAEMEISKNQWRSTGGKASNYVEGTANLYLYDSAIAWLEFVLINLSAIWHLFEMNTGIIVSELGVSKMFQCLFFKCVCLFVCLNVCLFVLIHGLVLNPYWIWSSTSLWWFSYSLLRLMQNNALKTFKTGVFALCR